MKIDTSELYVACPVYDNTILIEPWVQYDTTGLEEHHVYVNPKKVLVREVEEDGKKIIVDCKTSRRLFVVNYTSSFESSSSCGSTIYLSGWPLGPLREEADSFFRYKASQIQFLIPFREYASDRLGLDIEQVSMIRARAIVNFLNATEGRTFKLSFDKEKAASQIRRRVFHKKPGKTKVR